MRKQPRISTAPIIQLPNIQQGAFTLSPLVSWNQITITNTTATTNVVTTSSGTAGYIFPGQAIVFGTAIGGLLTTATYYVVPGSITSNTFQVSGSPGGSVYSLSTASSGGITATLYTYISIPVNTEGTTVDLRYPISTLLSSTGTVSGQSGANATLTLTGTPQTTANLAVNTIIQVSSGNIGTSNAYVTGISSSTVLTINGNGSNPANGAVTNITIPTPQYGVSNGGWYLDITGIPNSINYSTTVTVLLSYGSYNPNPTLLINGIAPTLIGSGSTGSTGTTYAYYYTIICTGPNQYSYYYSIRSL